MQVDDYLLRSCVVLTTPERFNLFSSVLGDDVDARFDPDSTRPLDALLETVALAGGDLVVLDEAHFYRVADLVDGVDRFLDGAVVESHPLRIIVVCSRRGADDAVLAHLVLYDAVYDLIYDAQGVQVTLALARLVEQPGTRRGVMDVLRAARRHLE